MIRVILLLCVVSRASFEMQSFEHQTYVTKKSRSNAHPIQTGYVYSRVGKAPGKIHTFDKLYEKPTEKYTSVTSKEDRGQDRVIIISDTTERDQLNCTGDEYKYGIPLPYSKQSEEHVKAESKCLPKKEAVAVEDHVKTIKHNEPAANILRELFVNYGTEREFRIDDEDLRTDSRNTYNGWPYSYQGGPYQYQIRDTETMKKAIDKRFLGADTSIVPVYKNKEDFSSHNQVGPITNSVLYEPITTDNPIYGNQPFFSFVLNDYFDRNTDEDPMSFKDFTWAEDFDHGLSYQDDTRFLNRRSDYNKYPQKQQEGGDYSGKTYNVKNSDSEILNNKSYDINQTYGKHDKSNQKKDDQTSKHGYEGHHRSGFKDFVDFFANKFGSENNNKNTKLMLKQNQDKSEKRKGFHRVYHKDEYQEDKEFYDNTHRKAHAEENGGSRFNVGGSHALLHSNAVAAEGNKGNLFTSVGNSVKKIYEDNKEENEKRKGDYSEIDHYKDIAKKAALSNNANYFD